MSVQLRALIVEDSENDALLIIDELRDGGYDLTYERVETQEALEAALDEGPWDIIIADYRLPSFSGLDALALVRQRSAEIPVIVVSGAIGEETAIETLKAGATDYVLKDRLSRLGPVVQRALREVEELAERRHAEEAALRAKEEWERTFNAVPDLIAILDNDRRIVRLNKTLADRLGLTPEECVGKPCYEVIHGISIPPAFCPISLTYEHGTAQVVEVHEPRLGGHFLVSTTPLFDDKHQLTRVIHVARDITDRKRAEEALSKSESQLRTILDNSTEGIVVADLEGRFFHWNQAAIQMFGFTDSQEYCRKFSEFADTFEFSEMDGTVLPVDQWPVARILRGERLHDWELRVWRSDTDWQRILSFSGSLVLDANGQPIMAVGTVRDITERKKAEEKIQEARERAEHQFETLQRALLPAELHVGEGYKLASAYISAFEGEEIGGDFYDIFENEDGSVGILIGDVSGKGIEAASLGVATRNIVRAFAYETSSPSETLTHSNSLLIKQQVADGQFVSVFLAILDRPSGEICYSSAGHPPPVLYHPDGSAETLRFGDIPVGIAEGYRYQETSCRLEPGDRLILYTDGITEARHNADLFELSGLERVLFDHGSEDPENLVTCILFAAKKWTRGQLNDDAAIIVIEREGAPSAGGTRVERHSDEVCRG